MFSSLVVVSILVREALRSLFLGSHHQFKNLAVTKFVSISFIITITINQRDSSLDLAKKTYLCLTQIFLLNRQLMKFLSRLQFTTSHEHTSIFSKGEMTQKKLLDFIFSGKFILKKKKSRVTLLNCQLISWRIACSHLWPPDNSWCHDRREEI